MATRKFGLLTTAAALALVTCAATASAAITVTKAEIALGKLVVQGTRSGTAAAISLDGLYNASVNGAGAFSFSLTYLPPDCIVDLKAVGGTGEFQKTDGGFEYSYELVQLLRELGGFSIGVAGFPEGHIACREGKLVDWQRLKHKIDCGADFVITQLFFDNADFYEFRDHLTRLGVTVPIVPGIIPIGSAAQIKKFTALCGAKLPTSLVADLEKYSTDDAACAAFGIEYATRQCQDLLASGAPGVHFYTLNKAAATTAIVRNLGLAQA